ncbi:hypothetical protein GCM10007423_32610 [Dyadobacter endophyticus]|uniref:Uncharacterized protein n=1 Tax=Dyadobacter endophyticus TaxID=1749036 RepID=A0ABQ1YVK2_9BACT|nr:hypothetical protein GCM10007423_32610 [Dyadobacter endophyticus]
MLSSTFRSGGELTVGTKGKIQRRKKKGVQMTIAQNSIITSAPRASFRDIPKKSCKLFKIL